LANSEFDSFFNRYLVANLDSLSQDLGSRKLDAKSLKGEFVEIVSNDIWEVE